MKIAEIRAQYPQYQTLTDGDLAYRLWAKSYQGKVPMGQFADQLGIDQNAFGEMLGKAKQSGYTPTEQTFATDYKPPMAAARAFAQGQTFGLADELVGGGAGLMMKAAGSEQPLGDLVSQQIAAERQRLEQGRQASPGASMGAEIAGAVMSPAAFLKGPAALERASPAIQAAVKSGVAGAAYGAGSAEGGIAERAQGAIEVGIPSAIIGTAGQQVFRLAGRTGQRIANAMKGVQERPTVEGLRAVKQAAYDAVEQSGATFNRTDMKNLYRRALQEADDFNYVPDVDKQTFAALKMLDKQRGKDLTIGQLDKLRQGLWNRYNASNGKETAIMGMIDGVDELIESMPITDDLMGVARAANSRYKKAELLENAFNRADLQTASTGSGGNVLNKYRQAVTSIITNPKQAKWFTPEEITQMEQFVRGGMGENFMRRIGKLSPSGNGLMLALNIGAVAANPMLAGVGAAGAGAKAIADASAMGGAEQLMQRVATGRAPTTIPFLPGVSAGSAAGTEELMSRRNQ